MGRTRRQTLTERRTEFRTCAYEVRLLSATLSYRGELVRALRNLAGLDDARVSLADAGSAIFGASILEIAMLARVPVSPRYVDVKLLAGLGMKYLNALDDAIDDPAVTWSSETKAEAIREAVARDWPQAHERPANVTAIPLERASAIGAALRQLLEGSGDLPAISMDMERYARAQGAHVSAQEPHVLLTTASELGRACGAVTAGVVGVHAQAGLHAPRHAAECLGAYGLLLDHAYELHIDLETGAKTAATAIIADQGSGSRVRRAARRICLAAAYHEYHTGRGMLTTQQRALYDALARLFWLRYRIRGLSDRLSHRGACPRTQST